MSARFAGKSVLVTGASSGIGRAAAVAFAAEGATVTMLARNTEAMGAVAAQIEAAGGSVRIVGGDVSVEPDVEAAVVRASEDHGRLDIAFNSAGVFRLGSIVDGSVDDWDETLSVNLTALWFCLRHEMRAMVDGGAIVNMSSNLGPHMIGPDMGAYSASKAAASALAKTAALEGLRAGIRVNSIAAGPVETSMSTRPGETAEAKADRMRAIIPIGRAARVDEVVAVALWLASDEASYVVGHDLVLDGGQSL